MVDVYYPYVESEAKWQELKYSLRSIEKNFPFEFKVWITGDLPEWVTGVNHIPHKRCVGMQENTTYDAIAKLIAFCNHPHSGPGFIRMYDDIYFLNEVSLDEINQIKVVQTWEEIDQDNYEIWYRQLICSLELVKRHGYRGFSTESHFLSIITESLLILVSVKAPGSAISLFPEPAGCLETGCWEVPARQRNGIARHFMLR